MIQRYLGNKNSIIEPILTEVGKICNQGDWICDIFAGTLSVSMALKRSGYRVIANDINKFSYAFGVSYLKNNSIPSFDFNELNIDESKFCIGVDDSLLNLKGKDGFSFLDDKRNYSTYKNLVTILNYLNHITASEIPKQFRHTFFFDTYTPEGKNSHYKSLRGTSGKRRFFTPENGKRIDLIINKLLHWKKEKLLNEVQYLLLVSILAESIEKVSNTQGTFHDFPRDTFDSRALKKLFLRLPPFDDVISTENKHIIGKEQDSLEFIKEIRSHKLIYIDPPYNFRQYTSYYFMLNLICDYCEIESLEDYFNNVEFVRGQNLEKDFKSTFCQSSLFIPSLENLIKDANTEYVMMSYFNGRNHSNNSIPSKDKNGIEKIESLFNSELFVRGSFKTIPIKRLNYQSFNGHKAQELNEYLFIAQKNNK
ncbi:DNA adenine methylase [Parabacteroides sp. FAFU027]|uniref:DNA adenine methylase n=1 Tax=Parabacteroides sp. FAFU027 TaxID=2922715 RepID=UPI001FAE7CE8|nr:DNA adenine methylase [Parabacteroides sp. FAFU027]